jgi:FKBP-type peptidyl-prolyl cis-trans isomerase FklB
MKNNIFFNNMMNLNLTQQGLCFKPVKLFLASLLHNSYYNFSFFILSFFILLSSCSSDTEEYNAYVNWEARNKTWYEQIADSARTAIRSARAQYGNNWEQHCDWRMLKSLQRSQTKQSGNTTDSVCVRILNRGTGDISPTFSDTIRVSFRGWLMPTKNAEGATEELCFTQTYYGDYSPATAAPQLAAVGAFTEGFSTVLQYMVVGDDWLVYIPQELFYGSEAKDVIPAYSTAKFRIQLAAIYPAGTYIPEWR